MVGAPPEHSLVRDTNPAECSGRAPTSAGRRPSDHRDAGVDERALTDRKSAESWICNDRDARALAGSIRRQAGRFAAAEAGNTAIVFALALPVLVAAAGAAVDYSTAASTRSKMQAVADSAALASARELQLARTELEQDHCDRQQCCQQFASGRDHGGQSRLSGHDGPGGHRETIHALFPNIV